ncbi:MAG: hypothetical protein KAS11_03320 [Candidatus Aenigmarchaeota archaeon]|nr:hypothetical protein [Candidatus Aenigmarchaeota archaeon]
MGIIKRIIHTLFFLVMVAAFMMFQDNPNNKQITGSDMFGRGACGEAISGFAGTPLSVKEFTLTSTGILTINIRNGAGITVLIDAIELDTNPVTSTSDWNIDPSGAVINGASEAMSPAGSCYSYNITLYYTMDDFEFISIGGVRGTYK